MIVSALRSALPVEPVYANLEPCRKTQHDTTPSTMQGNCTTPSYNCAALPVRKPQNYGQAYCRKEDAVVKLPTSLQHMPHSLGQRTSGASEQLMNIALPLVAPMESEEEHLPLENDKPSAMYFSPPHLTWGLELIMSYTARKMECQPRGRR